MKDKLDATADPQKIIDTIARRIGARNHPPDRELHDYIRNCLRIARRQGRKEGRQGLNRHLDQEVSK